MSSYIDVVHPERHAPYLDIPDDVVDYLHYLDFVKLRSPRTVNGYYLDLRGFFRYMMQRWQRVADDTPPEEIDLTGITTADIRTITKHDIFDFLDHARSADNGPKARARKLSALKGFFNYMCTQVNRLPANPTENISLGSPARALPKYLTRDEAVTLLSNIQSDFYERDYCILTLFLNCGMRLAELVTIDMGDFRDDTIRIVGKGSKERLVYLNDACLDALQRYKKVRTSLPNLVDRDALFVSKRTGKRLSARRIEQIVARCLQSAGLSGRGFSPHKLRHTAATLMYQGGVDMLAYSLIDTVVDSYFGVIEQLNDYAEKLEDKILGRPDPATLEGIHQLKRCVSQLRRNLHPLREVLGTLHRDAGDFFRADIQLYIRDVYDHTVHILESLEDLRDLATGLLDVYLSTISHRVNLEVRTLTVVATIFMPATLIAGIFGMNFREMPWLADPGGFSYALGCMGVIATIMLLLFWRRRFV